MSETSKKPRKSAPFARRKSVASSSSDWVKTGPLRDGQRIPLVVRPALDSLSLVDWARQDRARIDELLLEHRALLFRGFGVDSVDRFHEFVMATSNGELLEYRDRTTPRTTEGDRVYTATVHPADQRINAHNEGTYWKRWAQKLYFCCLTAPDSGGETPISDVRSVHDRIDPEVREVFAAKGFMLIRNYNDGFGLRWQEVFQTESRDEVESFCRDNEIEFEWKDGDRLRTRQVRPAIRRHPKTKEEVWFNHAAFYHYTTLDPQTGEALIEEFGQDGIPYNTCYGDGSPISARRRGAPSRRLRGPRRSSSRGSRVT